VAASLGEVIYWAAINASLAASRLLAHDSGPVWLATAFTVTDLHRLPSAGL
jgi:hypothetical protein